MTDRPIYEIIEETARGAYKKGMTDQLEEVIEVLEQCKKEHKSCVEVLHHFQEELEAMRPQQQEDN